MSNINVIQERVCQELKNQNVDIYFIDCYIDNDMLYFVYTFDESILDEATQVYGEGYILEGAYDDCAFDCNTTDDRLIEEMCNIIKDRLDE